MSKLTTYLINDTIAVLARHVIEHEESLLMHEEAATSSYFNLEQHELKELKAQSSFETDMDIIRFNISLLEKHINETDLSPEQ
jgi:hypothetical protein